MTTATKQTKQQKAERAEAALKFLRRVFPKGTRLHYDITSVSNAGTFKTAFYVVTDGDIMRVSAQLSHYFGYKWDNVSGCLVTRGESPAGQIAYDLGLKLHNDPGSITATRL